MFWRERSGAEKLTLTGTTEDCPAAVPSDCGEARIRTAATIRKTPSPIGAQGKDLCRFRRYFLFDFAILCLDTLAVQVALVLQCAHDLCQQVLFGNSPDH